MQGGRGSAQAERMLCSRTFDSCSAGADGAFPSQAVSQRVRTAPCFPEAMQGGRGSAQAERMLCSSTFVRVQRVRTEPSPPEP